MEISDKLKELEAEAIRLNEAWAAAFEKFVRLAKEEGWTQDQISIRTIQRTWRDRPERIEKEVEKFKARREKEKSNYCKLLEKEARRLRGLKPLAG